MLGIIVCQLQPSKSTFELNTDDLQLRLFIVPQVPSTSMGWNPTLVLVKDRNTDRRTTPGGAPGRNTQKNSVLKREWKKINACYSCCCCCYFLFFFFFFFFFFVSTSFRKTTLGTRLRKTVSDCNGSVNSKSPMCLLPPS